MSLEINGQPIETTANGYLSNQDDWTADLANDIAAQEGIVLTEKHWDLLNYLRSEFFDNAGVQPNTRNMVKAMSKMWGEKISSKVLYDLFPMDPSKQGGRIAGLPESRRKGGY